MASKTSEYYKKNPEARKKRLEYQKKYNKKAREIKKRTELNKYNRENGTYGNGDKMDAKHSGSKIVGFQTQSKNRGSKTAAPGDRRARGKKK